MEPVHDIENIKWVMLMDLTKKRRQLRYETKKGLNLTEDDTVESVVSRAEQGRLFEEENFELQVDKWLSQADKVFSH